MLQRTLVLLCGALVTGGLPAAKDDAAKELKKLSGAWKALSVEEGGKVSTDKEVKQMRMVFKGDRFTASVGDVVIMAGKFKVDASKKPKAVDLMSEEGRLKGQTAPAIYELDGDALKLCLGEPDGKRPAELRGKEPGHMLILYQREGKK